MPRPMEAGGGGGRTRGGGSGRYTGRPSLPDIRLADEVKRAYYGIYGQAAEQAAKRLKQYIDAHAKPGEDRQRTPGEAAKLFSGVGWRITRHSIAKDLSDANRRALEDINAKSPEAYADGANETLFALYVREAEGGCGQTRGGGAMRDRRRHHEPEDPLPYTDIVAAALIAAGLIEFAYKRLNRRKDVAYIEKRIQSIAISDALMDKSVSGLADGIARRVAESLRRDMDVTTDDVISSAYDTGIYDTDTEAQRNGVEVYKTWLGIMDNRIRDSHAHLNGQTIPIDHVFHGFNGDLRYPHDPKAPPAETRRCRCRLAVHRYGHKPVYGGGTLLPSEVAAYQKWREKAIHNAGRDLLEAHKRRRNNAKLR